MTDTLNLRVRPEAKAHTRDGRVWRRMYVITLLALFLPLSWLPQLPGIEALGTVVFAARFVAGGALAALTWHEVSRLRIPGARIGDRTRWLIGGLWGSLAICIVSLVWSVNPLETAFQCGSLFLLCATVHGLAAGRWASFGCAVRDLRSAATVLGALAIASLGAYASGMTPAVDNVGRVSGVYTNPNALGLLSALGLALLLADPRRSRARLVLLGLPLAATLVLSQSRTAAIALAIALLFLVLRRLTRIVELAFVGLLIVTLSSLFFPHHDFVSGSGLAMRVQEALDSDDPFSGRGAAWWLAWHAWRDDPLVGYGYGTAREIFEQLAWLRPGLDAPNVHNSYLQWMLELGIVGLLPLSVLVLVMLRLMVRGGPYAMVVTTGFLVQLTESAMLGTGQPYPYVFWLAVLAACIGIDTRAPTYSHAPPAGIRSDSFRRSRRLER